MSDSDLAQPILRVRNLAVAFRVGRGEIDAVTGIDFDLHRGETLAILGESGSGKSVSASAIMGILDTPPGFLRSGEVLLDNVNILTLEQGARRKLMGEKIAMIFQDTLAHLNPVYSVGWQIAECFRTHRQSARADAWKGAIRLLEQVNIADAGRRATDFPHQFSGGQRQRIMIAMALALEPDILIADEPTTALDVTVQSKILDLLIEMRNERNMGLLLITHDLGVAAEVADRVLVMHKGQIVEQGPVHELFARPQHAYTKQLLGAIPGPIYTTETTKAAQTVQQKKQLTPILQVQNLSKHYTVGDGFFSQNNRQILKACDGISFDLFAGETLGIVGESGSGKTTLANLLLKLIEPTSGGARFNGEDIYSLSKERLLHLRRRFQAVFQDPFASLNPTMSVFEIISEPWLIHQNVVPTAEHRNRVATLLGQVGMLTEHADRYPHEFSGGQRQRIAIARALALEPEVIICDEAVSALDVSIQAQIIELLARLRDSLKLSFLFIAHDLPIVRELADRVIVMQAGKIVEQGTVGEIFDTPKNAYTIDLLAANPIPDPVKAHNKRQRRGIA